MQIRSAHSVFPDFLSLTYHPEQFPDAQIRSLLLELGFVVSKKAPDGFAPPDGHGLVRIDAKPRFTGLSFSGGAISHVLRFAAVGNLLQVLTLAAHRVTRLDLAKDYDFDTARDVARRLATLWRLGRSEKIGLGRKRVPAQKVTRIESVRRDSCVTGTVYFGSRKDRYFAKVYDKRAEVWVRQDVDIMRERLRVEVTACRRTATLNDFLEPDGLFYYLAAPDLVPAPATAPEWRLQKMDPLELPPLVELTGHEKLIRLIENSPDIETLRLLIADKPTELPIILRKLEAKLRADRSIAA